jgi:hypothetical protein
MALPNALYDELQIRVGPIRDAKRDGTTGSKSGREAGMPAKGKRRKKKQKEKTGP